MIFETIEFIISLVIAGAIIGLFFYKTYQIIRNQPPKPSPWKHVQARVLASRATETFRYGKTGLEVDIEYTIDGKRYTGTGETVLYAREQPPNTVELVYKQESPEAWEWAEDHSETTGVPSETRFAILFIWFLLILITGLVIVVLYFPSLIS
ncbi:hypothetical protein KBD34_02590 [Patescibacteria group bacterium]|nr:hypothetical protein [Patescibacteria group bacterium]